MNSKRHSGGHVLASRGIAKLPHLQVFLDGWGSAVVGWGRKPSGRRAIALASKRKLPFLLLEDGFLRSVERSGLPLSLIVDDIGIYYDASAPSRLERLVPEPLSEEQVRRTLLLMRAWRDGRISKYNHARDYDGPLPSRFVLVVDQTFGDASVRHGLADASSFQGMLQAALDENPECSVLVKSHPDVVRRRKRGYFEPRKLADHPRVKFILDDCRPARLLEQAEAVYTVTSQLGFEALIWGKRVRCFGMPFYAGWGLTDDALAAPARRKSATLEQLVHASLVRYPRYRDLHGETPADVEAVIEHVTLQTRMRARFSPELHALGFSWWKAPILKRFLAGSKLNFVGRMSAVPPNATVALWGARHIGETPPGTKIIRIEDGFLRSVGLGSELSRPVSWICDEEGIYYDASRPSRLERILSETDFDQLLLRRAGKLRQAILRARLTKYNLGAPRWVRPARAVRVILVPGQVESDASLRFGAPGIKTNLELLKAVRQANPDAYLVYKPHPDVAAGVRHQPGNTRWSDLCDEVVVTADMAQLLEEVDEVHTLTSLTGFEALLRELPVTCYGQPFYAGWGLSCDMIPIERRKRRLSLDELVAGSLILYPTYHSRSSAGFITPEQAVAELSAWRSASAGEPSMVRKLLRPLLYLRDLTEMALGRPLPASVSRSIWRWTVADDNTVRLMLKPGFEKAQQLSLPANAGSEGQPRRRILALSFAVCVLVPAFLAAMYYAFIASDRYVSGAGFAVRGMDSSVGADLLGAFTGLANVGSTASDSYILLEFLEGRDLVEKLERSFPLRDAYGAPLADFLYRLDPDTDIEHMVEYWADRIHTTFDTNSGIITFQVEAFRPEDAARISELVLSYCKTLVNELSANARKDAVAYAEGEVERAEARLRTALEKLRQFRVEENALDPGRIAQLQIEIVGGLEKELAETRARISALQGAVDENSPAMRTLRRHAEALEKEVAEMNAQANKGGSAEDDGSALSGLLASYETLEVERNFAQQAYTSALSSLERARVEADRQQRYLAVFSEPLVPQYPLYPQRVLIGFLVLATLTLLWGIGVLVVYAVRDHIS